MSLDTTILDTLIQLRTPFLTPLMLFFTWLGGVWGVLLVSVVAIAILIAYRQWQSLIFFVGSVAGSALLMAALKVIVFRLRPPAIYALATETSPAFPSGHAMVAIALYGALIILLWNTGQKRSIRFFGSFVLAFVCLTIGFSRLYLGVHWPTDVLGGYILGALWLWTIYRLLYNHPRLSA